ncbi:unnamed protein product [Ectocarpus sp. 6 AP-2014]
MRLRAALGGLVAVVALLVFLGLRSQVALLEFDRPAGVSIYSGYKTEKYSGWKLADDNFKHHVDPQKARVVFYIMVANLQELPGLDALLRTLYHVDHFFLVHLDVKASAQARQGVESRIERVLDERGNGERNVRFVSPAMPITWGGFTMTLNAVYGLTQALHWNTKWDYFINLSASDLPLLRADEIAGILGEHKAGNTSFITGFKYEPSWEGYKFVDRREMFAEDEAVMRNTGREKRWPWAILDAQKEMLRRPMPNIFTVHKGEFWVMLHRSMAEYVHKSPDNQARMLLTYSSGMMVSDEEFFQTVACNPFFPYDTLRVHNDNLRFVNWWGDQASPAIVPTFRAVAAANSGALFGRKFSSSTEEGRDGVRWVESYLAESSRSKARVDRVKRRLESRMSPAGEPVGFCGKARENNPPEAFFAVEGEEEVVPPGFEPQPPRRGGGGGGEEGGVAWEEGNWTGGGEDDAPARGGRRLADMASIAPLEGIIVGASAAVGGWRLGAGEAALLEGAESPAAAARHSGGRRPPRVSAVPGTGSLEGAGEGGADQQQHDEGDEEVEADNHEGGEDVQLQGDSTRADLNKLTAVNTPIPRGAMHLNKVRSPHYHRTQYLSNLGIWAKKEAKHLNSSRQTEARYKSNLTPEAAVAAKKNPSSTTTTTPGEPSPVPPPRPPGTPPDEALLAAATSRTAGSARPQPAAGEGAAVSEVVPSESPRPQPAPRNGGHDHPRRQEDEETGSPPSEASGGGSGGGVVPPQPTSTGAGGRVGVVAAAVGASSLAGEALDGEEGGQDTAVVAAAAVAVAVTAPARSQPSAGAATVAPPASAAGTADSLGATDSSADDSSTTAAVPATTQRRNEQISSSSAAAPVPAASTPAAAIIPPLPGAPAAAQPTSSSSSPSSHRLRSARTVADPLKVGSPPLRAVRPPRRDIRRDYLTNLGMKRAVVAGPGDARTPPPMIRRSSFIESVENPVEEQLKDPNAGEITLEGVLRVVGSILTGGNSTKKEREPRPCRTCERLRAGNSSGSSANSSPTVGWHGGAQDCRGGEGRRGVQGSGGGARVRWWSLRLVATSTSTLPR